MNARGWRRGLKCCMEGLHGEPLVRRMRGGADGERAT
jgi:hypothetical protein